MDEPTDNDPVAMDALSDDNPVATAEELQLSINDDPVAMDALTDDNPVATTKELQLSIDQCIMELCDWTATLPFANIEGISKGEEIDLFLHVAESTTKANPYTFEVDFDPIRFNRSKYPPTKDGLRLLSTELNKIAWLHGTQLINRQTGFTLNCSRCSIAGSHKKKKAPPSDNSDDARDPEYDENGIKAGIRQHHYHCNRNYNREKGRQGKKTTYTTRPTHKEFTCSLTLRLGLREDKYYYLVIGTGCNRHSFHPRVQPGSQSLHIRHMTYSARKLAMTDSGKSSAVGNTS